MLNGCWENS